MRFADLVSRVGKANALLIIQNSVTTDLLKALSWEDHVDFYKTLEPGSAMFVAIESLLCGESKTLAELLNLYQALPQRLELKEKVQQTISSKAKSFDDWLTVYDHSRKNSPLKNIAWTRVLEKAETFTQCWQLKSMFKKEDFFSGYQTRVEEVFSKLKFLAQTFEDWFLLYKDFGSEEIFEQTLSRAGTIDEILQLCSLLEAPAFGIETACKEHREQAKIKMKSLAKTFEDWLKIYDFSHPMGEERDILEETLMSAAKTFSDWFWLFKKIDRKHREYPKITRMVKKLAVTFEQKIFYRAEIIKILPKDNNDRKRLLAQIEKMDGTFKEWLGIYTAQSWRKFIREIALNKIFAMDNSFEDWLEFWQVMTPKDPRRPEVLAKLQTTFRLEA